MLPALLQVGLPGATELSVIVAILFVLAIPILVIGLLVTFLSRNDVEEDRVERLEREVAELRAERETATGEPDDAQE